MLNFIEEAVNDDTINNLELCMKETDNINSETSLEEKSMFNF